VPWIGLAGIFPEWRLMRGAEVVLEMVVELSMENVAADSVMSVESLNSESSKEAQWL
jgi:hypothetical protein